MMKKRWALLLAAVLLAGAFTGCNPEKDGEESSPLPSYSALQVGEDYSDLKAELRILTNRTDLVNTDFARYVQEFQKLYPNVSISYEGMADYASGITARLSDSGWGEVCMVPTGILVSDLGDYFHPLCTVAEIQDTYHFASHRAYDGVVYGIPSTGNVKGVVYNKKVFAQAGYSEEQGNMPKTPDDFLTALQAIKDKTDAIPLYTNFAAGWTITEWDGYIGAGATGDEEWLNVKMPQSKDPFASRGDGTGPYAVYSVLYEAVLRELTEEAPAATDWEGSKSMLNRGEIGAMVLGSWALPQIQQAGPNREDVACMPFPITQSDGTQCATAGADYCYGVNKEASRDQKLAAMLYIKWLSESSGYAAAQGGVPVRKGQAYPESLAAFAGARILEDKPAPLELTTLQPDVNRESGLLLGSDITHGQRIVEAASTGEETLDDILADWNASWNTAVEAYSPAA